MKKIIGLILVAALSGCATSSVVVGTVRPAIAPAQVKLYAAAPAKYEQIALLETSSEYSWAITEQGKMNHVIENLKEEAAKLGANGVLLAATGNRQQNGMMFVPSGNVAIGVPIASSSKTGNAVAIYVTQE